MTLKEIENSRMKLSRDLILPYLLSAVNFSSGRIELGLQCGLRRGGRSLGRLESASVALPFIFGKLGESAI